MRRRPLLAVLIATTLAVVAHPSQAHPTQLSLPFEKQLTSGDSYAQGAAGAPKK